MGGWRRINDQGDDVNEEEGDDRQEDSLAATNALIQKIARFWEGFSLEDFARDFTPEVLARRHDIHVAELERRRFPLDGAEAVVDLYGEGQRAGTPVTIIGEYRPRIYGPDVDNAVQRAAQLAPQLPAAPITVLYGFVIHPSAKEAAGRLGAILIANSGPA